MYNLDTNVMDLANFLGRIWLSDSQNPEAIYFYAHQNNFFDKQFSIIPLLPPTTTIYLLDAPPGLSGCLGFIEIKKRLIDRYQVLETRIKSIPFLYLLEGMVNTLNESLSVVQYLKQHNMSKIVIASPPFHLPRAFLTLLSTSFKINYPVNIYCASSYQIEDWDSEIYTHCQGKLTGTISQLLEKELERIEVYQNKGDLISINKALEYLKNDRK